MHLEVINICARKSKLFKLSLKKLCWFLVFCYVFGVSLWPDQVRSTWSGGMSNETRRIACYFSISSIMIYLHYKSHKIYALFSFLIKLINSIQVSGILASFFYER